MSRRRLTVGRAERVFHRLAVTLDSEEWIDIGGLGGAQEEPRRMTGGRIGHRGRSIYRRNRVLSALWCGHPWSAMTIAGVNILLRGSQ